VPTAGSIIHPLLTSSSIIAAAGDIVRLVAVPATGVDGDVKITAGSFKVLDI